MHVYFRYRNLEWEPYKSIEKWASPDRENKDYDTWIKLGFILDFKTHAYKLGKH